MARKSARTSSWYRVRDRIVGTMIGVPLGLLYLPLAPDARLLLWCTASLAMIIYAIVLPTRYDIACGSAALALVMTMAVSGEHCVSVLVAPAWETLLGGAIALMVALPLRGISERPLETQASRSLLAR